MPVFVLQKQPKLTTAPMDEELKIELIPVVENLNPTKDKKTLYDVMDKLGISFRKTNCNKCLRDYYYIVKEELGLIDNAAEMSDFNGSDCTSDEGEYIYIKTKPVYWNGHKMDGKTDKGIIREFLKTGVRGYYHKA